jgi:hypothetical protein
MGMAFNSSAMTARFLANLILAAASAALLSCASSTKTAEGEITKVNRYRLNSKKDIRAVDPAIPFEHRRRLYGALTTEEMAARDGNYITVQWSVADRSQPVVVRLQYRQSKTGAKVITKDVEVASPRGSNVTEFEIVGDDYVKNGHVTAWSASLVRGKQELVSHHSYLWQ